MELKKISKNMENLILKTGMRYYDNGNMRSYSKDSRRSYEKRIWKLIIERKRYFMTPRGKKRNMIKMKGNHVIQNNFTYEQITIAKSKCPSFFQHETRRALFTPKNWRIDGEFTWKVESHALVKLSRLSNTSSLQHTKRRRRRCLMRQSATHI